MSFCLCLAKSYALFAPFLAVFAFISTFCPFVRPLRSLDSAYPHFLAGSSPEFNSGNYFVASIVFYALNTPQAIVTLSNFRGVNRLIRGDRTKEKGQERFVSTLIEPLFNPFHRMRYRRRTAKSDAYFPTSAAGVRLFLPSIFYRFLFSFSFSAATRFSSFRYRNTRPSQLVPFFFSSLLASCRRRAEHTARVGG